MSVGRLLDEKTSVCLACGESFQPRYTDRQERNESILCSMTCSFIFGSSTKNIRIRGRTGGMPMRTIWLAGQVLSDRLGVWLTAAELREAISSHPQSRRTCGASALSRMIPIHTNIEVDRSGYPIRFRLKEPRRHLADLLSGDRWQTIHANYSSD